MKVHLCCGKNHKMFWLNVDSKDFGQEVIANLNNRWCFLKEKKWSSVLGLNCWG